MKLLHVIKSKPDDITRKLVEGLSEGCEARQFELYQGEVDYDELIKQVFESEKVICWW